MRGSAITTFVIASALAASTNAHADDDDGPRVPVHVTSRDGDTAPLVVERRIPDVDLWESVCTGTCDRKLPADGAYRLSGRGIRPSLPISFISNGHDPVRLDVRPTYSSGWAGGVVLTIMGPLAMVIGTFVTVAGASQTSSETEVPPCPNDVQCTSSSPGTNNALLIGGVGMLGVGLAVTIAGIFGLTRTDHSTVTQIGAVTLSARSLTIRF
jgi:hypothetical protein